MAPMPAQVIPFPVKPARHQGDPLTADEEVALADSLFDLEVVAREIDHPVAAHLARFAEEVRCQLRGAAGAAV
jgi:hypothetical protein